MEFTTFGMEGHVLIISKALYGLQKVNICFMKVLQILFALKDLYPAKLILMYG